MSKDLTILNPSDEGNARQSLRRVRRTVSKFMAEEVDVIDVIFFGGIALVSLGLALRFGIGWGMIAAGSLLVLSIKPVREWFTRQPARLRKE